MHEDLSIADLEHTLNHDVALLRNAPGVSKHLNIYGYFYDINSEELIKVVEDLGG
jgi:carbonic anhydrase